NLQAVIDFARKKHKDLLEKGTLKGKNLYWAIRKKKSEAADSILRAMLKLPDMHRLIVCYGAVDREGFEDLRSILRSDDPNKERTPFDKAFGKCFSDVDRIVRTANGGDHILWIADRGRESETAESLRYHRALEAAQPAGSLILGQMNIPVVAGPSQVAD